MVIFADERGLEEDAYLPSYDADEEANDAHQGDWNERFQVRYQRTIHTRKSFFARLFCMERR